MNLNLIYPQEGMCYELCPIYTSNVALNDCKCACTPKQRKYKIEIYIKTKNEINERK